MYASVPDYLIREQAAVGALFVFAIARVIVAVVFCARGLRIGLAERAMIGVAALYCTPQLFDLISLPYAMPALAALEGKAAGCTIALFCAPIVSHLLGYE